MQKVPEWVVNKKQTAIFFGIATQSLDGWMSRGCPHEKKPGRQAVLFYLPEVVAWRYSGKVDGDNNVLDLQAERARLAKEQADKTAMENARIRGELVPVQAVRQLLEAVLSTFKTRVLALPSKLAPLLIGLTSPVDARDVVDNGLTDALNELSRLSCADIGIESGDAGSEATTEADSERVGGQVSQVKS